MAKRLEFAKLDISSRHRGVAVIIGNSYTRTDVMKSRRLQSLPNAPIKDTQSMREAFDYLKFFTIVMHDLTQDELISLSYSLANYFLPKSCQRFVLSFSGHGGNGFIYSEDEKRVKINDIVSAFTPPNCNDCLAVIPRLFFFDTCRGDLRDSGHTPRGGDERWQSKIPSAGDMLVAYATTEGYKAFEGDDGGFWSNILAKKLVSSNDSIYDVLTEVNRALINKIRIMHGPDFQQPELLGRLNTTVRLLQESGQPPKFLPELQDSQCVTQPPLDKGHYYKSPKCKLNELCQSMKFPSPNYQSQMSNGFLVVTVSIRIEGQEVCYSYTSEQVSSTKKNVKPCEENAAEIAYKALSELYETNVVPLQRVQSYHEPPDKPVLHSSELHFSQMPELHSSQLPEQHPSKMPESYSYPGENGSPGRKHKSQLNEMFQKYGVTDKDYSSSDNVTNGNVHNFRATLTYTIHGRRYQYESRGVFGRKQDAEEDAAQQALRQIEQQQQQQPCISSRGVSSNLCKSWLKERYCDKRQLSAPQYTTQSSDRGFVSTVNVPQYKLVTGPVGSSKKEAEQLAAMEALRQLNLN